MHFKSETCQLMNRQPIKSGLLVYTRERASKSRAGSGEARASPQRKGGPSIVPRNSRVGRSQLEWGIRTTELDTAEWTFPFKMTLCSLLTTE